MRKALMAALLPISALAAVGDKEVATCAAKTDTVERLACFDALASRHSLAPHAVPSETAGAGKWRTTAKIDPLSDKSVHVAILMATSGQSRRGNPIALVVRCANNTTEMYINWNDYLGSEAETTYRVDKRVAFRDIWTVSSNKQAAFYPESPIPLLKKIANGTRFVANVTPYNENPVTAVFDTAGAEAAFKDIRKSCGW